MFAISEWRDAMKPEPRRPAPYRDVAMLQPKPARFVAALQPAEQEDRGQAQRHRDDRRAEIVLVLVLIQGHAPAWLLPVDQTRTRSKPLPPRPFALPPAPLP